MQEITLSELEKLTENNTVDVLVDRHYQSGNLDPMTIIGIKDGIVCYTYINTIRQFMKLEQFKEFTCYYKPRF